MPHAINRIAALVVLLILQSCAHRVESAPVTDEHEAAITAEQAFLTFTDHKVPTYSVHLRKHTADSWLFLIQGEGDFARPGYQWFVSVDNRSGKAEVAQGQ
jgi:hypothetical protein